MKNIRKNLFPILLLLGIVIGTIIGMYAPTKAVYLKPIGDIFINFMFMVVTPLVFATITSAVANMINLKRLGKIIGTTLLVFVITGVVSAIVIIITLQFFPINSGNVVSKEIVEIQTKSVSDLIVSSLSVSDFPLLLSRKNMLPLIIFSIAFGTSISMKGGFESPLGKFMNNLSEVVMKMVDMVMLMAPIGLGAFFANLVAEYGPSLVGQYARVVMIYYPLVFIYMIIFFPIYSYISGGIKAFKRMIKFISEPSVTAFATGSSLATLPVNKRVCDEIGVPKDISDIVLPLGATMHMDGSVIASITKIAFLYGMFGMEFAGLNTYLLALLVSILSAVVLSGAPGAGMVGELLIVSVFGFPPEAFPVIRTIGFIVDPPATMLNASGDTIASMLVTRFVEGKNWIKK